MSSVNKKNFFGVFLFFIIFSVVLTSKVCLFAQAQDAAIIDLTQQLKLESDKNFEAGRFLSFLDYLNNLRTGKEERYLPLIDYYIVLTKSLYLDYLEQQEDWKSYYDNTHKLDKEIIDTANQYSSRSKQSAWAVDMLYLGWKAHLREEDKKAGTTFNLLIDNLIALTEAEDDTSKFQEIADTLSRQGQIAQVNRLFGAYKEYLLSQKTPDEKAIERLAEMAQEYLRRGQIDTACVVYEQYIELALLYYSKDEIYLCLREIAEKFRHHGFWPAKRADFAEKVYAIIERELNLDVFTELDLFARGYNLDVLLNYRKAAYVFQEFLDRFPKSRFIPEVYTRLGIINLYIFADIEAAVKFYEKVKEDYEDSIYAPFCVYELGLIWQWKNEDLRARSFYGLLLENEGEFGKRARARMEEINKGLGMLEELYRPFKLRFQDTKAPSTFNLTLDVEQHRSFFNRDVVCRARAQDYSLGTIQPEFEYEWFRDLGTVNREDVENVPEFTTTYEDANAKIVCFSASFAENIGVIFRAPWTHKIDIISPHSNAYLKVKETIAFSAKVEPCTNEENYFLWEWQIDGPEAFTVEGKKFSYSFAKNGHYTVTVKIFTRTDKSTDGTEGAQEGKGEEKEEIFLSSDVSGILLGTQEFKFDIIKPKDINE